VKGKKSIKRINIFKKINPIGIILKLLLLFLNKAANDIANIGITINVFEKEIPKI